MKCVRCKTENIGSSSHCDNCGAPLNVRRSSDRYQKRKVLMIFFILFIWAGGFTYFFRDVIFAPNPSDKEVSSVDIEAMNQIKLERRKELAEKLRQVNLSASVEEPDAKSEILNSLPNPEVKALPAKETESGKEVIAGWLSVVNPWGQQVAKFRSSLAGDGWLALPSKAVLGGNRWYFYPDFGERMEVNGGLWVLGDILGLWHISKASGSVDAPGLSAWNSQKNVDWLSIESAAEYKDITINRMQDLGFFIFSDLPGNITEAGLFVQNGSIVGWSFGKLAAGSYMLSQKFGAGLNFDTWVDKFYNDTFANGQEEKFSEGLSMSDGHSAMEQLSTLVSGFDLPQKLLAEETPFYLFPDEVVKQIRVLVAQAIHSGSGAQIVEILTGETLKRIGDINLLMDIVPELAQVKGYEKAILVIENAGREIVEKSGMDVPALNGLHKGLYQDWLQTVVSSGNTEAGQLILYNARAYYPDDPYLHLLAVELSLLNGNWQEAEQLLDMRNYPPAYLDRYELLAIRISEMKTAEGRIVIRFPAGSTRIPVNTVVNESMQQSFLLDTGASMVTIPSSTADALRLEKVMGHHNNDERFVSTAGGVVAATEVVIDSLEVDGWVEHNIKALVLDIPDQPGLGLLGLNYLSRFQMDLKPEQGLLLLNPR